MWQRLTGNEGQPWWTLTLENLQWLQVNANSICCVPAPLFLLQDGPAACPRGPTRLSRIPRRPLGARHAVMALRSS